MEEVRTTISVTESEAEFLKKKKLSPSTLAKIALDEFFKGKISELELMNLPKGGNVRVTVLVPKEQREKLRELGINLSYLVRAKIRELMA